MSDGHPNNYPNWIRTNPPPDLQALVERYGGYWDIPQSVWDRFQEEMRAWQQRRRDRWLGG